MDDQYTIIYVYYFTIMTALVEDGIDKKQNLYRVKKRPSPL